MGLNSTFVKKEKGGEDELGGKSTGVCSKGHDGSFACVAAVLPPSACFSSVFGYLMHLMSLLKCCNSIDQYGLFFYSGTCVAFYLQCS